MIYRSPWCTALRRAQKLRHKMCLSNTTDRTTSSSGNTLVCELHETVKAVTNCACRTPLFLPIFSSSERESDCRFREVPTVFGIKRRREIIKYGKLGGHLPPAGSSCLYHSSPNRMHNLNSTILGQVPEQRYKTFIFIEINFTKKIYIIEQNLQTRKNPNSVTNKSIGPSFNSISSRKEN